jgi:hypothetical protein
MKILLHSDKPAGLTPGVPHVVVKTLNLLSSMILDNYPDHKIAPHPRSVTSSFSYTADGFQHRTYSEIGYAELSIIGLAPEQQILGL